MATIVASATGGSWNTVGAWVGGVVPGSGDDVQLASTSGPITVTAGAACRSLDCTGYTSTLTVSNALTIGDASGGALKLASAMTLTTTAGFTFASTSNNGGAGWPITTAGKSIPTFTCSGVGGKWVLQDNLTMGASQTVAVTGGAFLTNGKTCTTGPVTVTGANVKTLDISGSTINIAYAGAGSPISFPGSNFTFTWTTSSVINLTGNAAGVAQSITGNGNSFPTVNWNTTGTGGIAITGTNTFRNLSITRTTAQTLTMPVGNTTVTRKLTVKGATGQVLSLVSATPGQTAAFVTSTALVDTAFISPSADVSFPNRGSWDSFGGGANQAWSVSAWVRGTGTVRVALWDDDAGKQASAAVTLSATYQRVTFSGVTGAAATSYALIVETDVAQSITFYVDGEQAEQKPVPTPYVDTNGGTASRAAARVQAPAALLDETQCWAAFRIRYGWGTSQMPGGGTGKRYLLDWRDDPNNLLGLYFDEATKTWVASRAAAGVGGSASTAVQTVAYGDMATVVFACDAAAVKVSVNGAPFVAVANSSIPTLAATLADLGSQAGTAQLDGWVKWVVSRKGVTLTDTDAAFFWALGNTDPTDFVDLPGDDGFIWPANTAAITLAQLTPADVFV